MYILEGKKEVGSFPEHLDLELTTRCNLRCPKCFQSFDKNIPSIDMRPGLFSIIIMEGASKGLKTIKLNYRGEPLLYEDIDVLIKYATGFGIKVMFNTNGLLFTPELSRKILEAGTYEIMFSIDACDSITYKKICNSDSFFKVQDNLIDLVKMRNNLKSKAKISIHATKQDDNKEDMKSGKFESYWEEFTDEIMITDYLDLKDIIEDNTISDFCCDQLWNRLIVLADGTILACCGMYYPQKIVGHIVTDSIENIWTSELYEQRRNAHLKGESHKIKMCRMCPIRKLYVKR